MRRIFAECNLEHVQHEVCTQACDYQRQSLEMTNVSPRFCFSYSYKAWHGELFFRLDPTQIEIHISDKTTFSMVQLNVVDLFTRQFVSQT